MSTTQVAEQPKTKGKLVSRFADRYGVDANKMMSTLKDTAFQAQGGVSDSQMMALLIVADQYTLNPFTKEIYAYPDKNKGIVPIVSVDGWTRIVNSNPNYDGSEFTYSETMVVSEAGEHPPCPEWVECVMYRNDRTRPIIIREYFDECYKPPFAPKGKNYTVEGPWQSHPKRFLRHKTWIQCARMAFGFAGIYDQDEAANFVDLSGEGLGETFEQRSRGKPETAAPQSKSKAKPAEETAEDIVDAEVVEDNVDQLAEQQDAMQQEYAEAEASNAAEVLLDINDQMAITTEAIQAGLNISDLERHFGYRMNEMPMSMHAQVMAWIVGQASSNDEQASE